MIEILNLKKEDKLTEIVALGKAMFQESRFAPLGFDEDTAFQSACDWLRNPGYITLGAFEGDELVGLCIGVCAPLLECSKAVIAVQQLLYLSPEFRKGGNGKRLVKAFIEDALMRGAENITFSNGTGVNPEEVEQLYSACGMTRVGGVYSVGE